MTEDAATFKAAKAAVKRMNAVRDFPDGTCPASRHVALMAEALEKKGACPMLQEEPRHCAESMAATVEALWKARALLDKAGIKWWGDEPAQDKEG